MTRSPNNARPVPDWLELGRQSPLIAALPVTARRTSAVVDLNRTDVIFRRGDQPKAVYYVIFGEVRLVRGSRAGGEIVLQRTRSGFIAEASIDQSAYHCDAVAVEPSRLLAIPRKHFLAAMTNADFHQHWLRHLTRELRRVRAHAERLSLKTARERIVHFIEAEGDDGKLWLTQSKKAWAAELGLTHEALYRTLAQMLSDGELIEVDDALALRH